MEEIYVNMELDKPVCQISASKNRGPGRSKKRLYLGVIICFGILIVFRLVGLIAFGVHSRALAADLSNINDNLTERLQDSNNKLSSMTKERDLLNANLLNRARARALAADLSNINDNLTERLQDSNNKLSSMTKERDLLNANLLNRARGKTCPTGWTKLNISCYFLSPTSGSWNEGRMDCRTRGADLVAINDTDEQTFLSTFAERKAWIGLNDKEAEGSWKWVDGTSLTLAFWAKNQPDNGDGDPKWGQEDCALIKPGDSALWNDLSCAASRQWICEKLLMCIV